jgi:2-amino-4-hydroxy-6-hydroxymethyldihydropteridine diphosphokinase
MDCTLAVIYLGLGTNLGDRAANLRAALRELGSRALQIDAISSVYETAPVGFLEQPDFWNIVVRAATTLEPPALMSAILDTEYALGRQRTFRNAPRSIDVDILLYDDRSIGTDDLVVPHPRMLERMFVLMPLIEIAPDLRHPVTRRRFTEAVAEVTPQRVDRIMSSEELLSSGQ